MQTVLNRELNKISFAGLLRAPEGVGNVSGGNAPKADDSGQPTGDDSDDGDDSSEDDDPLSQIFKAKEGDDAGDDEDLILPDDDGDDDTELSPEQIEAGKNLATKLKGVISNFAISESDIPDDFDINDKASVSKFMTDQGKKQITTVIGMVPEIINHALGITLSKIDGRILKAVKGQSQRSEAHKEFNSLGYAGSDREFAKSMYERAIKGGQKPAQAAKATDNAMRALGKGATVKSGNGGRQGSSSSASRKEGVNALDDLFGPNK